MRGRVSKRHGTGRCARKRLTPSWGAPSRIGSTAASATVDEAVLWKELRWQAGIPLGARRGGRGHASSFMRVGAWKFFFRKTLDNSDFFRIFAAWN